jgi:hypothetical protein
MKMPAFGDGHALIAGHKVSYGLLGVLLGVPVAAFAIYQFTQGGGLSAGTAPAATGAPYIDANGNLVDANGNIIGAVPMGTVSLPMGAAGTTAGSAGPQAPAADPLAALFAAPAYSQSSFSQPVYASAAPAPTPPSGGGVFVTPAAPSFLQSVQSAFSPIAPQLGGLLPGILTSARSQQAFSAAGSTAAIATTKATDIQPAVQPNFGSLQAGQSLWSAIATTLTVKAAPPPPPAPAPRPATIATRTYYPPAPAPAITKTVAVSQTAAHGAFA